MAEIYPTLYKKDTKGKIRLWWMERDGNRYRTWDGTVAGKQKASGWKTVTGKGIGKAKKTDEEQAIAEINSIYTKKLETSYHRDIDNINESVKFDPMLAGTYKGWPGSGYSQPKLDGQRLIAKKDGLWSRSGKPVLTANHIKKLLEPFFEKFPDAILDGELYNHDLKTDFEKLMSLARNVSAANIIEIDEGDLGNSEFSVTSVPAEQLQYHIYDLASHSGSFADRLTDLYEIFEDWSVHWGDKVQLVVTHYCKTENDFNELHQFYKDEQYEGQMWRNPDAFYQNKRTKDLLKRKEFIDAEFEVVKVESGAGNWEGYAKRIYLRHPDGRIFKSGVRGNQAEMKALLDRANAGDPPKTATIVFLRYSSYGIPNLPVAHKFYWEGDIEGREKVK